MHDLFWIDPEAKKGLVMGTSFGTGLARRVALVDRLAEDDVQTILSEVQLAG